MKITKRQLRRIIKEEKAKLLREASALSNPAHELKDIIDSVEGHVQSLFDNSKSPVDVTITAEELEAYVHDLRDFHQRESQRLSSRMSDQGPSTGADQTLYNMLDNMLVQVRRGELQGQEVEQAILDMIDYMDKGI